jgi:hypothetical protein
MITLAWRILIVCLPLIRLFTLPVGHGAGLPDLAAALLIAIACGDMIRRPRRIALTWIDGGALAWWAGVAIASGLAIRGGAHAGEMLVELMGPTLLLLLFAAMRVTATPERLRVLWRGLVWVGIIAALAAFVGATLALLGIETPTGRLVPFPYLGSVPRAYGFTPSPAMTGSLVMMAIFAWLYLRAVQIRGWLTSPLVLGLLAASFLVTQAKVVMALACGLLVAAALQQTMRGRRRLLLAAAAAVAVVTVAGTHVVVARTAQREILARFGYIAGDPLATWTWRGETWTLAGSNYWFNKRASILAIEQTWPIGVGPHRHGRFVAELMRTGQHPHNLWEADPHSTYFGTAAELGLAGVLGLLLFATAIWVDVARLRRVAQGAASPVTDTAADAGAGTAAGTLIVGALMVGVVVAVGVEAIFTDVMNFRHYWVAAAALACVAAATRRHPDPNSKKPNPKLTLPY